MKKLVLKQSQGHWGKKSNHYFLFALICNSVLLTLCPLTGHGQSSSFGWGSERTAWRVQQERMNALTLDTLSLEEMRDAFYAWAMEKRTVEPTSDTLRRIGKRDPLPIFERDGDGRRSTFPVYFRDSYRHGLAVGSSCYWSFCPQGERRDSLLLCLAPSPGNAKSAVESSHIEQLKAAYGEIPSYGIPARWVTDTFAVPGQCFPYGPFEVVHYLKLYYVDKGVVVGSNSVSDGRYKNPAVRGQLGVEQAEVMMSLEASPLYGVKSEHGPIELMLLSSALRPLLGEKTGSHWGHTAFSFLVHVDETGHQTLHLLFPETLNPAEKACFERLERAFDRLPRYMFAPMVCADGRVLPGRFLRGVYNPSDDSWRFEDYMYKTHFRPKR